MVKVLVAGDVRGRVDALAARVAKVTAKTPFDLLFCVGDFLDPDGDHDKVYALLKHQIEFALPTFIVSSGTDDWATVLGADAMTDEDGRITLTQNVQFLGRAGVFNAGGLQVAYVSGSYDALNYRAGRPDALDFSSYRADHIDGIKQSAASKQIDLLLTSEWPRSWHEGIALLPALPKQPAPRRFGAPPVADLCKHLKPRYHFAAGQDVFYQRVPYANPNVQHVTRFLSLAQVGNSGNEKYLYAFNCLPQSDAGYAASVLNVPPETTRNPFLQADLIAEKRKRPGLGEATANAGIDNTRFQLSGAQASAVRQDHQRKLQKQQQKYGVTPTAPAQQQQQQQQHGNQGNHPQAKRPHHDNPNLKMHNRPTDCWFCLASPKVEKHLVVAVGKV